MRPAKERVEVVSPSAGVGERRSQSSDHERRSQSRGRKSSDEETFRYRTSSNGAPWQRRGVDPKWRVLVSGADSDLPWWEQHHDPQHQLLFVFCLRHTPTPQMGFRTGSSLERLRRTRSSLELLRHRTTLSSTIIMSTAIIIRILGLIPHTPSCNLMEQGHVPQQLMGTIVGHHPGIGTRSSRSPEETCI